MPYAFSTIEPSVIGQVNRFDVPLNTWLGVKFDQGQHDTAFDAIYRATEDSIYNEGSLLTPEDANQKFGIPGFLDFKDPIRTQKASLMRDRKDAELRRMSYLNAATHSGWGGKALAGTLAGMAGGVSNPLDFSLMFMPFVGSEARMAGVAKMGGSRVAQALERGFITEESLAGLTRFPQFGASVINGTFGNALTEIPVFIQNLRDQAIYGPEDALVNIGLGGVTGGIFHAAGAGLKKILQRAADAHARTNPETQDVAARTALNDLANGRTITADMVAGADKETIRRGMAFDEAASNVMAEKSVDEDFKLATGTELINEATTAKDLSPSEQGIMQRLLERYQAGERSPDLFENMAALLNRGYDAEGSLKGLRTEFFQTSDAIAKTKQLLESTSESIREVAGQNIRKLEQKRNSIAESISATEQKIKQSEPNVEAIRQQRVQEIINRERAIHQASLEGKVDEEYRQQLKRDIEAGKILTPEQVNELTVNTTDPATLNAVKEQVTALESDLKPKSESKAKSVAETPVDAMINKLMENESESLDVADAKTKARDKAYDIAIGCLVKK